MKTKNKTIYTKSFSQFCCVILLLFSSHNIMAQQNTEILNIRESFDNTNLKVNNKNIEMNSFIHLLNEDGSFSDSKPVMSHMTNRLTCMTLAYRNLGSKNSKRKELRIKIYKALNYWLENKPEYRFPRMPFTVLRSCAAIYLELINDIENDKSEHSQLSNICIQLEKNILIFNKWCWYNGNSPAEFDKERGHNRGGNVGYRLWAMHVIAICSKNNEELDWLSEIVKRQIPDVVNTKDDFPTGKTPDGSWIQHNGNGAQHYWIGYGINWVSSLVDYAIKCQNTKWKLTADEYNQIADYYLDGYQWCFYKNRGALNIAGRHNSLKRVPMEKQYMYKNIGLLLENIDFDFKREDELKKLSKKAKKTSSFSTDSTKYFWNTDLLIHSMKNCNFTIKMVSERTKGCETSEGKRAHGKNNFLSGDGSTMILRTAKEYDRIRLVWDWRAIPGITAIQKLGRLPLSPWGLNNKSLNKYAGGLSINKSAIASFEYNRKHKEVNLKATKSYITYKDNLFALGNSISKKIDDKNEIWTTIDQTERFSKIVYNFNYTGVKNISFNENKSISTDKISEISWVLHNNIAYILFPQDENSGIELIAKNKKAAWADMDGRYANDIKLQTVNSFQLSINHGINNKDSKYAYLVMCNINLKRLKKYLENGNLKLISNNKISQAIYNKENRSTMIAFHKKGELKINNDFHIVSDASIIINIKENKNNLELTLSDPLQERTSFSLKITYKGKTYNIDDKFPVYPIVGKQITYKIEL